MGKLDGKVAFITGVARGQGRAHAVRLAEEGCDIIGVDICENTAGMDYDNASEADLAETVQLVEALDRRIVGLKADVRDLGRLQQAFDEGVAQLGRCDIVLANAGIVNLNAQAPDRVTIWKDIIDTNLTGVWNTCEVAIPALVMSGDTSGEARRRVRDAGLALLPKPVQATALAASAAALVAAQPVPFND